MQICSAVRGSCYLIRRALSLVGLCPDPRVYRECPGVDSLIHGNMADHSFAEIKKWLTKNPCLAASAGRCGCTLLHEAAFLAQYETAVLLLSRGADVNARNQRGGTPLHNALLWSAHYGRRYGLATALLLLDHGADPCARFADGRTPLVCALSSFGTEIVMQPFRRGCISGSEVHDAVVADNTAKVASMLKDSPTSVNAGLSDSGGTWRPLDIAARLGRTAIARLLLENGADYGARNESGQTPLHDAARDGHTDVVRLLLAAGADVNAATAKHPDLMDDWVIECGGELPIHFAAVHGHAEVVRLLIERGSDVNAYGGLDYLKPLDCARQSGNAETIRLIEEAGGKPLGG